jgi:hypothetical protein
MFHALSHYILEKVEFYFGNLKLTLLYTLTKLHPIDFGILFFIVS